jgi:hypothetical protein
MLLSKTLHTCCLTPRSDILVLDKKDKSCANPNAKAFNGYTMNKYQDAKKQEISFNDVKVQKALAKDAVRFISF